MVARLADAWAPQRLSFDEPAVERAWWAWFAAERGRVMRGGLLVLLVGIVLFTPLDAVVFPERFGACMVVRAAATTALIGALPAFFGRASEEVLARNGQEWLLYVCTVVFAALGSIGWAMAPFLPPARLYVTLVTMCLLLAGLYGATGLRVRYAAPLGLGTTALYAANVALRVQPPELLLLATVLFAGGANVLGIAMCRAVEAEGRSAFLRARELERERARSERLLLNVMPKAFADRLGVGACVERVDDATVLFATVTGFELATHDKPALDAVNLLDRLVAAFDGLAAAEGVERIKTIGATCMAVVGVTSPRADHAAAAARLALAMREAVRQIAHIEGAPLALRAGIASGPLVVGVIGRTRYAFDCWGDTVNTAARLDTHGEPGQVQVLAATVERLGGLPVRPRGRVHLKGKGEHETWWVG